MTFRLHAGHSLKEKRRMVQSLITTLRNRLHVSAAGMDEQDTHLSMVTGVAAVFPQQAFTSSETSVYGGPGRGVFEEEVDFCLFSS